MKTLVIFSLFLFPALGGFSQIPSGDWTGPLPLGEEFLEVIFHIEEVENGYSGTMDVPAQGAIGIPIDKIEVKGKKVTMAIAAAGISYEGLLVDSNKLDGTFSQAGMEIPLVLTKSKNKLPGLVRPQEPKAPFPYSAKEVTFTNKEAKITLAGTLTLPQDVQNPPVAILVSGSGPQNRDEELLGHKPFLVLADHLTRQGIAVLRFDDRGVGDSEGEFSGATSADFVSDALAAVQFLSQCEDVDPQHIGIIGHSEGGVIAPMAAIQSDQVDFIVMLAGTGVAGDEIILEQQELIRRAAGVDQATLDANRDITRAAIDIILSGKSEKKVKAAMKSLMEEKLELYSHIEDFQNTTVEEATEETLHQLNDPWFRYFLAHDPYEVLEKVECPVLSLIGSKDLQVPDALNSPAISEALKHNNAAWVVTLQGLNHLFQKSDTGSPSEYATIEETMSPIVLELVASWINERVGE